MYNGGLYQNGGRFALGDTLTDIAQLIAQAGNSTSQVIGTVNHTPVAAIPSSAVATPFGNVPAWLIPAAIVGAIYVAARSHRNPPRRRARRRRR